MRLERHIFDCVGGQNQRGLKVGVSVLQLKLWTNCRALSCVGRAGSWHDSWHEVLARIWHDARGAIRQNPCGGRYPPRQPRMPEEAFDVYF